MSLRIYFQWTAVVGCLVSMAACVPKNISTARRAARASLREAKESQSDAFEVKEAERLLSDGEHALVDGNEGEAYRLFRDSEDLSRSLVSGRGPSFVPDEKDSFHLNEKPEAKDPKVFLDEVPEAQWLRPKEDPTLAENPVYPWEKKAEFKPKPKPKEAIVLDEEEDMPTSKKIPTSPLPVPVAAKVTKKIESPKAGVHQESNKKAAFPHARKVEEIKKEGLSDMTKAPTMPDPERPPLLASERAFKERVPGTIAFSSGEKLFQSSSRKILDALEERLKQEPTATAVFQGQIGEGESIDIVEERFELVKRYLLEAGVQESRLSLDDKRIVGEWPEMKIYLLR